MTHAFRQLAESMESLNAAHDQARFERASRIAEALLFAASEPLDEAEIGRVLPGGVDVAGVLAELQTHYEGRGVQLVRLAGKWAFRTSSDLAYLLSGHAEEPKKLSRAALETLAIIAYHQPVTRAEIEEIRGVATNRGTLDLLIETGWVRMRGRRRTPGRPVTYGTTEAFLIHFNLDKLSDLPGLEEMKGLGLVEGGGTGFVVPMPSDDPALREDEDALEPDMFDAMAEQRLEEGEPPLDPGEEPARMNEADAPREQG